MDKLEANGVQMAVTGADNYSQPQLLRQSRVHLRPGPIWNLVDKTGLGHITPLGTLILTALGHKAGTDKKEATIAIKNRVLEGQYIYKYLTLG